MMATKNIGVRYHTQGGKTVIRDLDKMGKVGKKSMGDIQRSSRGASRGVKAVGGASQHARIKLAGMAQHGGAASAAMTGMGGAGLLAAGGVAALVLGLKKAISIGREAAREFEKISLDSSKLGLSTDHFQELSYAALKSGVSQTTFAMATQRATRRIEEARNGTGEALGVLKKYNIALSDSKGNARGMTDIMGDVAEKMKGMKSGGEALRLAFKLFDSEGAVLVNMLKGGRDALEAMRHEAHSLGLVIDESMIKRAHEASTQADVLSKIIDINLKQAFVDLAPVINTIMELFVRFAGGVRQISDAMKDLETMSTRGVRLKLFDDSADYDNKAAKLASLAAEIAAQEKQESDGGVFSIFDRNKGALADKKESYLLLAEQVKEAHNKLMKTAAELDGRNGTTTKPTINNEIAYSDAKVMKDWVDGKLKGFRTAKDIYEQDRAYIQQIYDKKVIDKVKFNELMSGLDKQYNDKITKDNKSSVGTKELNAQLSEAKKLYEDSLTPLEQYANIEQKIIALKPALIKLLGDEAAAQAVLDRALTKKHDELLPGVESAMRKVSEQAGDMGTQISGAISNAFSGLEDEIVNVLLNAKDPAEALSDLLSSIGEDLLRMGIKSAISSISMPFAKGGVFDGPIVPHAKGNVFNSPRKFMANGRANILGEAGPEAIMPLSRGKNGVLGLAAPAGAGGNTVGINIGETVINIDGAGDAAEVARIAAREVSTAIPKAINAALKDAARPGGFLRG